MKKEKNKLYIQKRKRFLKKIFGTFERPRLSVFRSHKHIYAQLIDDNLKNTIISSSTLEKNIKEQFNTFATKEISFLIGKKIAEKALIKNINKIIFDRGNRPYHGRIKSLAEGARQGGLIF